MVLSLFYSATAIGLVDFEQTMLSEFVLETKQIHVPGFPEAYNPSLIRFGERYLLSFRTGNNAKCGDALVKPSFWLNCIARDYSSNDCESEAEAYAKQLKCKNLIGFVFLDETFAPVSVPQIIFINYPKPILAERQHDPRLVIVGARVFMVYSNIINGRALPEIRRPFVIELFEQDGIFFTKVATPIIRYEGEDPAKWAKNWVPFDYNGELLLGHHISPHIIFHYDDTMHAKSIAKTAGHLNWQFGELRGGTPAVLDPAGLDEDGDYLAIFHSSKEVATEHSQGEVMPHYFMGAYTFSARPPFQIKAMSARPIVGANFYHGKEHKTWKPLRVVFPGGLVLSPDKAYVAFGRQDHEVWVATLDKKALKASLAPVRPN